MFGIQKRNLLYVADIDKDWFEKYQIQILSVFLIALSVVVYFLYLYDFRGGLFQNVSGAWEVASNLYHGQGYSACVERYFPFCSSGNQTTAMREPVPVFLMLFAMLISSSQTSGFVVQASLFFGTLFVIYAILRDVDVRMALFAAFLWGTSKAVLSEVGQDTGELASAFFLALCLLYYTKGLKTENNAVNWILAGVFAGLASLSRTIILGVAIGLELSLVVIALHNLLRQSSGVYKVFKPALLFLVSLGLVYSPWLVRNEMVFDKLVLGSTLTGYNVYRMNYIVAQEPFVPHYVGSEEGAKAIYALVENGNLTGTENEAQMQDFYMKAGMQVIKEHPVQYVELVAFRFLPLWFNISVEESYGNRLSLPDYIGMVEQLILLIAIVFGVKRHWKKYWYFILVVVLASGAYLAINAQLRYLVDVMPAVVILASTVVLPYKKKSDTVGLRYSPS